MKRIGIAGYMGSGKSTVAHACGNAGRFDVIDADAEAKHLMCEDLEVRESLGRNFGADILLPQSLRFDLLGERAFSSIEALMQLNATVHPPLLKRLRSLLDKVNHCILDAALIPLWNIEDWFDWLFWIEAPSQIRFERLMIKGAMSDAALKQRMDLQQQLFAVPGNDRWSIVHNTGSINELINNMQAVMARRV